MLSLRDTSDFKSETLIEFLDRYANKNFPEFQNIKIDFDNKYKEFIDIEKRLSEDKRWWKKSRRFKRVCKIRNAKIEEINPKENEYEEFNGHKKSFGKKRKLKLLVKKHQSFLKMQEAVNELLEILEVDSSFFDEAIMNLQDILEKKQMIHLVNWKVYKYRRDFK